ncbi:efflux transporter outer membrane subunit, partial [Aquabacterium sp.]|uniref:efflux transporter outer membrane subunit n=1 Tax=Aquabacterium sp. TaxID=1872578 RepID=UPI0025BFB52D
MRHPALFAVAVLCAGCTSMAPPYQQPRLPVPEHYEGARATTPTLTVADLDWRSGFTDPALQDLIERALRHNRDLRVATLRVEEARAAYGIQRADQWPSAQATLGMQRSRLPALPPLTRQPTLLTGYSAMLASSSWELDFWGRVRSLEDSALERFLASDEARRAVTLSLITHVADSYLALRELDERLTLARRTVESRQASLRIFTRRQEVGASSRLELTQVQTLLAQAQALSAQLGQQRAAQAHALSWLVGDEAQPTVPAGELADTAIAPVVEAGLPSALLLDRPDLIAAEHQLRAAHAQIGAARATFFPTIALTGGGGSASSELGQLFDLNGRAWTLMPQISLPIFDGGRRQTNLTLAEVRRDIAVAQYEQAIQGAFRDVQDALSAQSATQALLAIQRQALQAQSERARLARLRYDHGATTFLEVLDAERDLLTAE